MWRNPGLNDCPEGTTGYDTRLALCQPMPADHGTNVAGVIGAVGDNSTGIARVAWQVRLMDIRWAVQPTRGGFPLVCITSVPWPPPCDQGTHRGAGARLFDVATTERRMPGSSIVGDSTSLRASPTDPTLGTGPPLLATCSLLWIVLI